jgi:hypothetical protein
MEFSGHGSAQLPKIFSPSAVGKWSSRTDNCERLHHAQQRNDIKYIMMLYLQLNTFGNNM